MNGGQKAVVCVALGVVALVLGFAAQALFWNGGISGGSGWLNYAPNNGVIFSEDPMHDPNVVAQAAMWIALVLAWAAACLLVLRDRAPARDTDTPGHSTPD